MIAVIDADTIAFAAASKAEGMGESQAFWNVAESLDWLVSGLNNPQFQLYLTGENNFRYKIYPEYKANRRKIAKPQHLQSVKEFLVKEYGAVISDGCEADDLCGIHVCTSEEPTLLVHIDKDMDMIPGKHFSPEIVRLGKVVRPEMEYYVTPIDAIRCFYTQLLTGDSGDGVKGAPGIGKVKAEKILEGLTDEKDLYEACRDHFSCDEELVLNGQVLWIWRKLNDIWEPPIETSEQ